VKLSPTLTTRPNHVTLALLAVILILVYLIVANIR
jgi:hypothetical protein